MCAHCLILTARIKRAKDSGPRCLGKHSLKGPAKCITSPGLSSLYRTQRLATQTATNINFYYANIALITLFLRTRPANKLSPLHVCGQLFSSPHRPDQSLENWIFICAALSPPLSLPLSFCLSPSLSVSVYAISDTHRCLVAAKINRSSSPKQQSSIV